MEGPGALLWMIEILHYLKDPKTMGVMVYSLLWVMQDFYHQPHQLVLSRLIGTPLKKRVLIGAI